MAVSEFLPLHPELFCSSPGTLWLSMPLVLSHLSLALTPQGSVLPPPSLSPTFPSHSRVSLHHTHTHTHTRAFYTQNETSQQKLQSSRGIFTERKAQIPKPALRFTQISSPALKLYLSKAVPSFLETGKLFQGIEIVHMFWHWKFYIKLLSFRKVLKHRKNTEKQL